MCQQIYLYLSTFESQMKIDDEEYSNTCESIQFISTFMNDRCVDYDKNIFE